MALKPVYSQLQPYGEFDGLDSVTTTLKGGEVVGLTYVSVSGTDKAAKDSLDGYVSNSTQNRPAVTKYLTSGMRPLFLADEGTSGYGTLFGKMFGGTLGRDTVGSELGPHTAYPSGKVTCWGGPGMFTVTLDAVDTESTAGLQPTNTTLTGRDALYATNQGLLTPNVSVAFQSLIVGRFIEFTDNHSKVTTPKSMTQGTNSPYGVTNIKGIFDRALIMFDIED